MSDLLRGALPACNAFARVALASCVLALAVPGASALAQPVMRWIVPFAAGSYTDNVARIIAPGIAERLAAEMDGSAMQARRIEVGESDDIFEFMFDQGLTDGLPVVPPTPERVARMLTGTKRDPREVVATVPPNMAPLTVEKVAINAVMAGCKPE